MCAQFVGSMCDLAGKSSCSDEKYLYLACGHWYNMKDTKAAAELVSHTLTLILPSVTTHTGECLRMYLVGGVKQITLGRLKP